jgi:Mrp family chromosome partitioning ATPase
VNDKSSFELRGQLAILRRRKWFLLLVTAVVAAGALVPAFLRTPTYESKAEVLVRPITLVPSQPSSAAALNMGVERRIATSAEVTGLAGAKLGRDGVTMGTISIDAAASDSTLHFAATAPDPVAAQRTAQAFADSYLELRQRRGSEDLAAARKPLQTQIDANTRQLEALQRRITAAWDVTQLAALRIQLDSLVNEQTSLKQSLSKFTLPANLRVGQVLRPATRPRSPSSPDYPEAGALALLLGLSLGVGLTLLRDHLDQRVRSPEELQALTGAPVLAVVPGLPRTGGLLDQAAADPEAEAADVYEELCRKVLAIASHRHLKFLLVTGCGQQARMAVAARLGAALTRARRRVVLVAAEPEGSRLRQLLGLPDRPGTGEPLRRGAAAGDRQSLWTHCWVLHDNLLVVLPPQDLDLLAAATSQRLRAELGEAADFVLIDGAPVQQTAAGSTLTALTDGVLMAVDAGRATRSSVRAASGQLDRAGVATIGTVLVDHGGWWGGRDPTRPGAVATGGQVTPIVVDGPGAVEAQVVRFLRGQPRSASGQPDRPLVVVTGESGDEEKSMAVADLAFALAGAGRRVALVDLDLHRPAQHRIFDLPEEAGFAEVALEGVPLERAMHQFEVADPEHGRPDSAVAGDGEGEQPEPGSVEVLTAGALRPGEGAAVSGPTARRVLDLVRERADVVLVDAPPVPRVDDASSLHPAVAALVVVTGRNGGRPRLAGEQAAPPLGAGTEAPPPSTRTPEAGGRTAATRADGWLAASIAIGGAITLLLALTDASTVLRPVVTLLFLGFAPGAAFVWLLRDVDLPAKIVVSIALSLAIDIMTAQAMIWLRAWSPTAGLVAVVSASMVGLALQGWRANRTWRGTRTRGRAAPGRRRR